MLSLSTIKSPGRSSFSILRFSGQYLSTSSSLSSSNNWVGQFNHIFPREEAYSDGSWIPSASGQTFPVLNPANQQLLGHVADCGAKETEEAITAASHALPEWRRTPAAQRGKVLQKWASLMHQHKDDLASLLTQEMGKPLPEAAGEIMYSAGFLEFFAEEAIRAYGDVIPSPSASSRILVQREPVGVVGAITPWNFPSAMIARKAAAGLAAGCTMVIKPSELTPYSALALCELAEMAGVPKGVLNCIPGTDAKAIGDVLTTDERVKKISFTGSTRVGKLLLAQSANTVKRCSMELGGNAPFIVFDDADIDKAVAGCIACKLRNCGQTCVSANRIFVQEGVVEKFTVKLTEAVAALNVGNGMKENIQIGPMINRDAVEKVLFQVNDAVDKGGQVVFGSEQIEIAANNAHTDNGCFLPPIIVAGATPAMDFFTNESFGPVVPVFSFKTVDDVVSMANDTPAGLAAYFYSNNLSQVYNVAESLEYGMVAVNQPLVSVVSAPFGGIKESGYGREGSKYGLDDYTNIKTIHLGI